MLTSTVLVAVYWAELLEKSSAQVSTRLKKFTLPFIAVCIAIFTISFVTAFVIILQMCLFGTGMLTWLFDCPFRGLRAADVEPGSLVIAGSVLTVILAGTAVIYFVVQGVRVLLMLKRADSVKSSSKAAKADNLSLRTARYVIVCTVFQLLFIVVVGLGISKEFWYPEVFYTILTLKDLSLFCTSITQILVFKMPTKGSTSRGTRESEIRSNAPTSPSHIGNLSSKAHRTSLTNNVGSSEAFSSQQV
jgi:hypothetical protein